VTRTSHQREEQLANQSAYHKAGGKISRNVIKHPTGRKADSQLEIEKREKQNNARVSPSLNPSTSRLSEVRNPGTSDIEEGKSQSRRHTQIAEKKPL
jgi:hypothetical protein